MFSVLIFLGTSNWYQDFGYASTLKEQNGVLYGKIICNKPWRGIVQPHHINEALKRMNRLHSSKQGETCKRVLVEVRRVLWYLRFFKNKKLWDFLPVCGMILQK